MREKIDKTKVLIIEDEEISSEELVSLLLKVGISPDNLFLSGSAEKAIEIINDEEPNVVLLDLKIPYNDESKSLKVENSNKVIEAVERINAARNHIGEFTGIIIISASVDDIGIRNSYKNKPEIIAFFSKDEDLSNEEDFSNMLKSKIIQATERNFSRQCTLALDFIRRIKLNKLKHHNRILFERIHDNLLFKYGQLLNNTIEVHNNEIEQIIGLAGRIVEDILNLTDNPTTTLTRIDNTDNSYTVRNRLNEKTGRRWDKNIGGYHNIKSDPVYSRSAADFASYAYKLRSEALHSKEADNKNNKLFNTGNYTIEDATLSINLIMPLVYEFIDYLEKK